MQKGLNKNKRLKVLYNCLILTPKVLNPILPFMISFDFITDHVLENDRIRLSPLKLNHCEHLKTFAINEPHLWTYSLVSAAGEDNMLNYIQRAIDERTQQMSYPFIVYDKLEQAYAGSTRFYDINSKFETLQLGYTWYGQRFQGTGLNVNCKFLLLQFVFDQLGFKRVEFRADNENKRSIAAMKKIGCTVEGILRSNMPTTSASRRDSIVLSILPQEWQDVVKPKLSSMLKNE